jgi:hypothetical protein
MRSAFADIRTSATADSLRQMACQPKLAGEQASEGWTTDMFVEVVYHELAAKKGKK